MNILLIKNKLLDKYLTLSKPVKASIWFVISSFLLKGISFITLPIFTRLLSTAEYGQVAVYQSWLVIFSIITTLSVYTGGILNVSLTKYSDRRAEVVSSFQGLAIFITLIFLFISLISLKKLSFLLGISSTLIICMYLEILVQIPFNIWATSQRYNYEYKNLVTLTIINSILNPTFSIIAILAFPNYKVEAKIIGALIISFIIGICLFIKNLQKGKIFFSYELWKYGFAFGIVLIPHYLSSQVLNQSDRVMINWLIGSSDAGIYSVAYNFAMIFMLILAGIESSLTPYIYKSLKEKCIHKLYNNVTKVIILEAILAIIFICFLPDIFLLLLPQSYYGAIYVIPPVLIGIFFSMLYNIFGAVEFFYNERRYVVFASIIGAVTNIILNFIFIRLYGYIAAAYTTLVCYILFCTLHYIFMKVVMRKNNQTTEIYNIKMIQLISLLLIIINFIMIIIYNSFVIRWLIIISTCGIIILNRDRVKLLLKELKK